MQGQNQQQQPNSGVTDIQELMRQGVSSNNSDLSEVDSILAEIGNEKQQQQLQIQQQQQQQQQVQIQAQQQQAQIQAQQQMMLNRQEELERANMEKDRMLRQIVSEKQDIEKTDNNNNNNINSDILNEMKPTIIVFIVVLFLTLPFINKFICNSMGIEENAIYSILRTFIICVIFFLINKFV